VFDASTFGVIHPLAGGENNQAQVFDAATATFSASGTFIPQTGTLDSFNRADENPLATANWGGASAGYGAWKLINNQAAPAENNMMLFASANERYPVNGSGSHVLLVGDSSWSMIGQLTTAEMDTYLEDRASRGFNAVIVNLLEHYFSDNAPNNINNDAPFTGANWTTPNETYFANADHAITKPMT